MTSSAKPSAGDVLWREGWKVGFNPMDEVHRELVDFLDVVRQCSDTNLPRCIDGLLAHLSEHFAAEDEWMAQTGFPPRQCHMDEHARVLQSAHEVRAQVALGNTEVGRSFAAALADWFPGHTDYLDAALAHWMVKQRHGGKPVVLRVLQHV